MHDPQNHQMILFETPDDLKQYFVPIPKEALVGYSIIEYPSTKDRGRRDGDNT